MKTLIAARHIVAFLDQLSDFEVLDQHPTVNEHIGSILADTILQAGLRYETVVLPRVRRVINNYPEAACVSGVLKIIGSVGANSFLGWNHYLKPMRFVSLVSYLHTRQIETVCDLRSFLSSATATSELSSLPGIGRKSIDYLSNLLGLQSVAVDRHLRAFVQNAGVTLSLYDEIKRSIEFTADLLEIPRATLDISIWNYMSQKSKPKSVVKNMVSASLVP